MGYNIGKRIKLAREAANISAKDLAQKIGVSQTRLSNWETGTNRPMAEHIVQIAEALGISADILLGIETNPEKFKTLTTLQRGMNNMSQEQQKKLIEMAKILFNKAFEEGNDEIDV